MDRKIAVIGLGYVGLPVAVAFGKKSTVIGFDINPNRIQQLKKNIDIAGEISSQEMNDSSIHFTVDPADLQSADFHIVAVPTPVDDCKKPDLSLLLSASKIVGQQLKKRDIVVFESTVYPGATEEDCIPVLEKHSGLVCGEDFFVGYSPERINPGDKEHTFSKIKKIVSAQNEEILDIVSSVYESVVEAGVHRVSSIKVAEAAKVIENAQRDINIAFVNELSKIFDLINIDTSEVLDAAATKWNFMKFDPGLVGGHCVGVDPYYLTHKAEKLGYHPEILLAGRRVNDGMARHFAEKIVRAIILSGKKVRGSSILVLGVTFKKNCADTRNSKVFDLIKELMCYGVSITLYDHLVDLNKELKSSPIKMSSWNEVVCKKFDIIVQAVAHKYFTEILLPPHDIFIEITPGLKIKESQLT